MSKFRISMRSFPVFLLMAVICAAFLAPLSAHAAKIDCSGKDISLADDAGKVKTGILPGTGLSYEECYCLVRKPEFYNPIQFKQKISGETGVAVKANLLACGIKTGQIKLFMIPYFITSLIQFVLMLAGIVSVLFIVIGGYQFVTGGLTDEVDTAKKTITYAIAGLVVTILSWIIVNIVQVAVTG